MTKNNKVEEAILKLDMLKIGAEVALKCNQHSVCAKTTIEVVDSVKSILLQEEEVSEIEYLENGEYGKGLYCSNCGANAITKKDKECWHCGTKLIWKGE